MGDIINFTAYKEARNQAKKILGRCRWCGQIVIIGEELMINVDQLYHAKCYRAIIDLELYLYGTVVS